jgi:hypothetical protein
LATSLDEIENLVQYQIDGIKLKDKRWENQKLIPFKKKFF